MGTTVATNALLERKGEPTVLVTTTRLSRCAAHRLPGPAAHLRPPHRAARAAVRAGDRGRRARRRGRRGGRGRSTASGCARELRAGVRRRAAQRRDRLHARLPPQRARTRGRRHWHARVGFPQVSVSHEVSPLMKLVGRGDTTVVDAYLSPILRRYVDQVAARDAAACGSTSCSRRAGWPMPHAFQGKDAILSGPAGGIVGMARTARSAGPRPGASASTWAAPPPTSRTTPASSSARSRPRSPACGCARR